MGERRARSRRLVLREGSGEESVQEFARSQLGWHRRTEIPGNPAEGTERQVVWHDDPAIALHYFDEVLTDNGFVTVAGDDPDAVVAMTGTVEEGLNTWRLDELLGALGEAAGPKETAAAILRAGIGSPQEPDEGFVSRITDALRSDSPLVREASTWAVACSAWGAYREPLRWMADNDPDADLAKLAWMTLGELSER